MRQHHTGIERGFQAEEEAQFSLTPTTYLVRDGDHLASIAQLVYGDAAYAYLIADANGLDLFAAPEAGCTLTIPNVLANNNAMTMALYQPGDGIGDTAPVPIPPKSWSSWKRKLSGFIGALVQAPISSVTGFIPLFQPVAVGAGDWAQQVSDQMLTGPFDWGKGLFSLQCGADENYHWEQTRDAVACATVTAGVQFGFDQVFDLGLDKFKWANNDRV